MWILGLKGLTVMLLKDNDLDHRVVLPANFLTCFANVLIHFPNFHHLING